MTFPSRLLAATPTGESSVEILQAASRDHIPIAPKSQTTGVNIGDMGISSIPDSQSRPSVEQVLREISGRQSDDYDSENLNEFVGLDWYKGQIRYRKTFQDCPGRIGLFFVNPSASDI